MGARSGGGASGGMGGGRTMTVTGSNGGRATIIETTKNFIKKGNYKPTSLDKEKAGADFRITAAVGNRFEITTNKPLNIKTGKGIKSVGNGQYLVTDKGLASLSKQFKGVADF